MRRIGIIGVGSIGRVLAQGFDDLGHDVVINDSDAQTAETAPWPNHPKRWLATNCDIVVIAVPTPTLDGEGDASVVADVLESLGDPNATVVVRSTMPPGSTAELADRYDIPLVYSPEFLRDRSTPEQFFDPDRIVIAGPEPERERFRSVVDVPAIECETIIESDDYLAAEIGKEAHNAFFATKVSFTNQIRLICEAADADPLTAMDIVVADRRTCESHLDPRPGPYGGRCLPKDTEALRGFAARQYAATGLLDGAIAINEVAKEEFRDREIEGEWPDVEVAEPDPIAPTDD